jgi:hypothetical protein
MAVDHAKRTDVVVVRRLERHSGIKPQMQIAGDHGVVLEPLVRRGIRHLENVIAQNGVGTQRNIARRLGNIETDAAFEPLAVLVHQGDQGNGRIANEGGQQGDVVEFFFGRGVEKLEIVQRTLSSHLVGGKGGGLHD